MANRIKQLDGSSVTPDSGKPLEAVRAGNAVGSAGGGASGASGSAPDSVYITQCARTLAALSQTVQNSPEIDAARVAALQQSISAGLYNVDPERIAGLMLQLEQDLSGTLPQ